MKPLAVFAGSMGLLAFCVLAFNGGSNDMIGVTPAYSQSPEEPTRDPTNPIAAEAPLIVHEWGTFTSFSGSNGVKLEFRPLLENDLPGFVSNRVKQSGMWLGKSSITALQRMETPVTYFYTPIERDVSVKVEFPEGLLTEFYPPVHQYAPLPEKKDWTASLSDSHMSSALPLKNSLLDWGTVHLIPTESLRVHVEDEELSRRIGRHVEATMVPDAAGFTHYAAARATDAAIVQVRHFPADDGTQSYVLPGDYFEKFLFYRGVGNFELPLMVSESADGTLELTNSGTDDVRSLFLVTVAGEQVHYWQFKGIARGSRMRLEQAEEASSIDRLAEAMVSALTAEGLYPKEARAMVDCWRSSWFGEEGTRLLYMVPAGITDRLLPLHIDPEPDELVRVLVGRMEVMPTSQEEDVLQLVEQSAAARLSVAAENALTFRSPAMPKLLAMGRLAEPALVRIRHLAVDQQLREESDRLVAELRAEHK